MVVSSRRFVVGVCGVLCVLCLLVVVLASILGSWLWRFVVVVVDFVLVGLCMFCSFLHALQFLTPNLLIYLSNPFELPLLRVVYCRF